MRKNEFCCDCNIVHREIVERAVRLMPSDDEIDAISDFYKIMGDSTRCRIIHALLDNEMCVCDLANALGMSKSSISHQLAKMRANSVVKCRREGKEVYYSLDDCHISEIFATTLTHIKHSKEKI